MLLNLLTAITARIRAKPTTPVHLLIVQERLSIADRGGRSLQTTQLY